MASKFHIDDRRFVSWPYYCIPGSASTSTPAGASRSGARILDLAELKTSRRRRLPGTAKQVDIDDNELSLLPGQRSYVRDCLADEVDRIRNNSARRITSSGTSCSCTRNQHLTERTNSDDDIITALYLDPTSDLVIGNHQAIQSICQILREAPELQELIVFDRQGCNCSSNEDSSSTSMSASSEEDYQEIFLSQHQGQLSASCWSIPLNLVDVWLQAAASEQRCSSLRAVRLDVFPTNPQILADFIRTLLPCLEELQLGQTRRQQQGSNRSNNNILRRISATNGCYLSPAHASVIRDNLNSIKNLQCLRLYNCIGDYWMTLLESSGCAFTCLDIESNVTSEFLQQHIVPLVNTNQVQELTLVNTGPVFINCRPLLDCLPRSSFIRKLILHNFVVATPPPRSATKCNNDSLQELAFHNCRVMHQSLELPCRGLHQLTLMHCKLFVMQTPPRLGTDQGMQHLLLIPTAQDHVGPESIIKRLLSHTTFRSLRIIPHGRRIGVDTCATSAICINESALFRCTDVPTAQQIVTILRNNPQLTILDSIGVPKQTMTHLTEQMEYYMKLNQSGRHEVSTKTIPPHLLPTLLARHTRCIESRFHPSIMYYLLKEGGFPTALSSDVPRGETGTFGDVLTQPRTT